MFGSKDKIQKLEAKIAEANQKKTETLNRVYALNNYIKFNAEKLEEYYGSLLKKNTDEVNEIIQQLPPPLSPGWDEKKWESWPFGEVILEDIIYSGYLSELRQKEKAELRIPLYAPFIGCDNTIIIAGDGNSTILCLELLQAYILRIASMLPYQAKFTLIDPVGHGQAFPMSQYLTNVRENSGDPRQDLDGVITDMRRIIHNYLDASTPSFELVNDTIRSNEPFEFIFAANFPKQYDRRAIEALQSIGNSGPNAGRYLFIHYNYDHSFPSDLSIEDFENAFYIDFKNGNGTNFPGYQFFPETIPSPQIQKSLLERLRMAKPPDRILNWEEIVGLSEDEWWKENTSSIVQTPIGGKGTTDKLKLWFGVNNDRRVCAHGMLGAMTGAGKSNLYHVLILGLAIRYSPEELRLYLIDGKDGVEFQVYRNLPHVEVVSLRSAPELSRSILTELINEKERRNSLFTEVGVRDFTSYREKGQPKEKLARIILLIDEYQELFESDKDGVASSQILQLAQQGRSAGIHMLLASQRFGAAGMLNQTAIFGNIHLRIAMQMTLSDRQALVEFGREGKRLIEICNLPGKIVLNDASGDDGSNQMGKVAFLHSEQIVSLIKCLEKKAQSTFSPDALPQTVVFDGKAQPNLIENPNFAYVLNRSKRYTPEEWEIHVKKPIHYGGLDISDWFWQEHPHVMWLGQEYKVRGQAKIVIRRRMGENIIIVGNASTARYGMLLSIICSLSVTSEPKNAQFEIIDRSIPGTKWNDTLKNTCDLVLTPGNFTFQFYQKSKDATGVIEKLCGIMEQRLKSEEEELLNYPSIFFIITEPDRVDELLRKIGDFGKTTSLYGEKFKKLYTEGPSVGIHIVTSFSDIGTMKSVLDERRDIEYFRHRVALEMSEDDSFTLIRSRQASQLQIDGPLPVSAIYVDIQRNNSTRFKPYSTIASIDIQDQLKGIGENLKKWS